MLKSYFEHANTFEHDRQNGQSMNLQKVVERTVAATGASSNIAIRIKAEKDVKQWKFDTGGSLKTQKKGEVPEKYSARVRHVVREVYLSKTETPCVVTILERINKVKLQDVKHLNLFDGTEVPEENVFIWQWEGPLFTVSW